MSPPAIHLEKVGKDFRVDFWKPLVRALDSVTFSVEEGEVFGLVGPNGAGKTTAIKILMGLVRPSSGTATVAGEPASSVEAKHAIGYLPENAYYYDYLKTEEVLDFYGRLFGLSSAVRRSRSEELLRLVGLEDRRGVRLRAYSKGMLQRIGIAQALVNDPKIVIFDEPMSGLDPIGRKEVRDIILRLRDQGKTILFSSHILSDVEAICERVAILIRGKLKACGTLKELVPPKMKSVEIVFHGDGSLDVTVPWRQDVTIRKSGGQTVVETVRTDLVEEILTWGRSRGLSLLEVAPRKETLEDIFLEQVGLPS